jgi:hypothetical protein
MATFRALTEGDLNADGSARFRGGLPRSPWRPVTGQRGRGARGSGAAEIVRLQ